MCRAVSTSGAVLAVDPGVEGVEGSHTVWKVLIRKPDNKGFEIDLGSENGRMTWEARVEGSSGRIEISIDGTNGRSVMIRTD